MRDPDSVEPQLRFFQYKEFRDKKYINYADYIFPRGLKRHKRNAKLQFQYGNFLFQYKKNLIKAQLIYKLARQSHPSLPLRFVLYCISNDNNSQSGGSDKKKKNGMNTLTFNKKIAQAEEFHESDKQVMKNFIENLTRTHTNIDMIYPYLRQIVESMQKSRSCYEELKVLQPMNATVLHNYVRLLMDIYHDYDTADIILQRAEVIEEQNTQSKNYSKGDNIAQATDPLIVNADSAQSNITAHDQKRNERLNADILDQPNTVQNRSQKSSNQRKKRKKKKGRGEQGDSSIADLTGGQGEDNSSMRILIMGLVLITHFICIVGLIFQA
ncbi:MAG: hypothetical protein EZS28_027794, partial [Streblomastix strix]